MSRKIPREHISSRSCARMGANLGYHRCLVHGMNASRSPFGRVRSCRSSDNRVRVQQRTRLSPRRGKVMATHLGYQFFAPLPVQRVCPPALCSVVGMLHRVSPLKTLSAMNCGHNSDWTKPGFSLLGYYTRLSLDGESKQRKVKRTNGERDK